MLGPDLYAHLVRPLHASGVPYMVSGGVAAIIYGEPRLTNDVDVVIALRSDDVPRIVAAFPAGQYYVPPPEVIVAETIRPHDGHFNILHLESSLRADIYPAGDDPLIAWGMERRRTLAFGGGSVSVAPAEYVIVKKLASIQAGGSDRHRRDVASILRISRDVIDTTSIDDWVARLGLAVQWAAARNWSRE
jgi:hypothetical protein